MEKRNDIPKHFAASALILVEGKVLLVKHKKLGVWLYPGGHVEENETPDQAVVREVKEETGLTVEIAGEVDDELADPEADVSVLHRPYQIFCEFIADKEPHYHIDMIYLCRIIGNHQPVHNPTESDDIRFFSPEELKDVSLFPNFRKLLKKVLGKKEFKSCV